MNPAEKKLLIVDDSLTMRRILRATLGRCGYTNVEEAQNGVEASKKAAEKQYDAVMTDWNMPEMDGLELVKVLRKMPGYDKIPIMMVTTEGGKEEVVEALTQGATAYIVKPFTEDVLKAKMSTLFGGG